MQTEAQKRAQTKYDKRMTMQMALKFNRGTDADIIEWIKDKDNFQGYIKSLIRKDMEQNS